MPDENTEGLARQERSKSTQQDALFDIGNAWREHWWGMPVFEMKDAQPMQSITVHFMCAEDVREFAKWLGMSVTRQTKSAWYPEGVDTVDKASEWEWHDES